MFIESLLGLEFQLDNASNSDFKKKAPQGNTKTSLLNYFILISSNLILRHPKALHLKHFPAGHQTIFIIFQRKFVTSMILFSNVLTCPKYDADSAPLNMKTNVYCYKNSIRFHCIFERSKFQKSRDFKKKQKCLIWLFFTKYN